MRRKRLLKDGAVYHVTARTNRRKLHLNPKKEKKEFRKALEKVMCKYPFILYAFNIMGNHIHLLIQPTGDSCLSRIMQWLLSIYARDWNRRHNTCGHFWGDRFHSVIIESEEHFQRAIEYIENNAVRIGLVDSVEKWLYSSFHERVKEVKGLIGPRIQIEFG